MYCVNQLANGTDGSGNGLTWSWSAGVLTISGLATANANIQCVPASRFTQGHKYLIKGYQGNASSISFRFSAGSYTRVLTDSVITYDGTTNAGYLGIFVPNGTDLRDANAISLVPQVVDLIQWFNVDIPSDLLTNPSHFSWYHNYGDYIPYNAGSLESGNGRYLVNTHRNVWNEQWVNENKDIDTTTGQLVQTQSYYYFRSKDYIKVIPSRTYYLYCASFTGNLRVFFYDKDKNYIGYITTAVVGTFSVPSNAEYILFRNSTSSGYTYKNDITISLYYASGVDYDKYYPYEEPNVYDTGTETLLSTGVKYNANGERIDAHDSKLPSGEITHNVGTIKLKTLNWQVYSSGTGNTYYASVSTASASGKAICSNYILKDQNVTSLLDKSGILRNDKFFFIRDDSYTDATTFKNHFTDNDYLYYELATPTTEQGTPFAENIEIDDMGTMEWYSSYTNYTTNTSAVLPQGCKIFYPAWYVGFIDSLGQREDIQWKAEKIASTDQLLPQKTSSRLQKTLVLTGAESEDWSTSGSYSSVKRFNLSGTFYCYTDSDHLRGVGSATSDGLTIAWIQDSSFSGITDLSMCFAGTSLTATRSQLILLIPNSEGVSTVEQLRTWLGTHNITVSYDSSKYVLEATMLGDDITYDWIAK